ncbi:TlpA disulfide reductase family protein [uncultured Alistipes sp.]|uniref:TlpA disulfide reductase family protein n=1 Tax=uncultured Alistipes sp. TaxID=538949 RepID=UPI00272AEC5D|nr:TlpA disulfide reductase family protein [uncultured Alistipes sp.]
MKKFFFIFGMFLAASCHSGDINVDIALDSDIYEENDRIYLFVQYGNQLALIDSCRITDGRALFRGKIPQKEVLAEIMIPNKASHILLVAEGENIKLRVNKQTRSFFPMCEGSYATKRIAEIARRYREIGYSKLDSLKRLHDELPADHPDCESLARTIRTHERELSDLVCDALTNDRSVLLAITAKMWFCDSNPAIPDDSMARIVAGICQRFPDDPNLASIDPGRRPSPPTLESMKAFNLKAQLTGRPLPYPDMKATKQPESIDYDAYPAYGIGDIVQPFSLVDLSGTEQNIADYDTEFLLVDFWASWCRPCLHEIPHLLAVGQRFNKVLTIYAVSLDEDSETWKKAVGKNGMHPFANVHLSKDMPSFAELVARFGIRAIPHNLLLNRERRIIAVDLRGEALEKEMEKLIAPNPLPNLNN